MGQSHDAKSQSQKTDNTRKSEEIPAIIRHGYGVQYWIDGAHYEGDWYFNKAEG